MSKRIVTLVSLGFALIALDRSVSFRPHWGHGAVSEVDDDCEDDDGDDCEDADG